MSATSTTTRSVQLGDRLEITIDERGDAATSGGIGFLLLHGGAGPRSMAPLAGALSEHAYVVTPTHPGFDGTPRAPWLDTVAGLADAYLDLIAELGLDQVMVIGNSVGGWIASEVALRDIDRRLNSLVLIDAAGIRPDRPGQVVDVRTVPPAEIGKLSFHNPELMPNPADMTSEQRAAMAANAQTLALYTGEDFYFASGLRRRLHRVTIPTLVAWGEDDGIFPVDYGRAYAAAFANGHFVAIAEAGHMPQLEQPGVVLGAIGDFANTYVQSDTAQA